MKIMQYFKNENVRKIVLEGRCTKDEDQKWILRSL